MHKNRNKNRSQSPIKGITKSTVNLSGNAIGKKVTLSGADTQNFGRTIAADITAQTLGIALMQAALFGIAAKSEQLVEAQA